MNDDTTWGKKPLCPSCAANNHCHDLPRGDCPRCDCMVRFGYGGDSDPQLPEHRGVDHAVELSSRSLAARLIAGGTEMVGVDVFSRWYAVHTADGRVWLETSNLAEALEALDKDEKRAGSPLTLHRTTTYTVTTGYVPVSTEEIATLRTRVKPRRRREDSLPDPGVR